MKLRTKAILFFGFFLGLAALSVVLYAQFIVGDVFKKQATDNLRIIGEQTESSYFAFVEGMKVHTLDWAADRKIQELAVAMQSAPIGTLKRAQIADEFASYVREQKFPYSSGVFLADLLDKDGVVIATTRLKRMGVHEKHMEDVSKAHSFSKAIKSNFGEVFVRSLIFEPGVSNESMIHAVVRVFVSDTKGIQKPTETVLLLHFSNTERIAEVLSGEINTKEGGLSNRAILSSYQTSKIYLVNSSRLAVTPSRFVNLEQKIDTLPVRECFEHGREINGKYQDHRGISVFGASTCLAQDELVLMVEIDENEILAPLQSLVLLTIILGVTALLLGIVVTALFLQQPLKRIRDIINVIEQVVKGDLSVKVKIDTKDETGHLASMFNTMIEVIRGTQQSLQKSKRETEEKARVLEEDIRKHVLEEKFLEESKRATLNLLEDSWKAKEKLSEEGNKLQTILSSIEDGLLLIDPQYKIILVNKKVLQLFELNEADVLEKDLREVMKLYKKDTPIDIWEWPTETMFATKKAATTTIDDKFSLTTVRRMATLPVVISVAPLTGRLLGAVVVIRDVTADYELDEAKSGFISVASHQLRSPLTSVRWYSEMLLSEDAGPLNKAQEDFIREIHSGAKRLYQTVDLLLGISRVESGKIKADLVPISLHQFTDEILKELKTQKVEKHLTIVIEKPEGEDVIVHLDAITFRQVLLNLVFNAVRYTNEMGNIKITWYIDQAKKEVVYSVADDGIGVPKKEHIRIFSKFFRAENARAQVPDGSGLGLALVKDLVISWGGRIWFESEENHGAIFSFTIPLEPVVKKGEEDGKIKQNK